MSISMYDADRLRNMGFLDYEIEAIANATDPEGKPQPVINLETDAWVAAMENRRAWWDDKVAKGWEEEVIINEIMRYYDRDKKRNPWDFLKAEYRPPKRIDYWQGIRARKQREMKDEMEGYY